MRRFLFITCLALEIALITCCVSDSFTNGCSIPLNSSFPYKTVFHPACQRHDVCYSCGSMHGWTRTQCDDGFHNDMVNLCKNTKKRRKRDIEEFMPMLRHKFKRNIRMDSDESIYGMWDSVCEFMAQMYHTAVSYFGHSNYEATSPQTCSDPCVIPKGQPNLS